MVQLNELLGVDVTSYNHVVLESSINLELYYNTNATHVHVGLTVDSADVDWLGFGVSETGHMKGGDMVTLEFEDRNGGFDVSVADNLAKFAPLTVDSKGQISYSGLTLIKDHNTNDWSLEAASGAPLCGVSTSGSVKHVLLTRELDTGDTEDRVISQGLTPIIWAWGTGSQVIYHGSNRGSGKIDFFETPDAADTFDYDDYFEMKIQDFAIPAQETTYTYLPFQVPVFEEGTVHVTAFEVTHTHPNFHHGVFYSYKKDAAYLNWYNDPTDLSLYFIHVDPLKYTTPYSFTAPESFKMPSECGFRAGHDGDLDMNYMSMQVHYDNPKETTGLVDNETTIRFYYKKTLRTYDCGSMTWGDYDLVLGDSALTPPFTVGNLPASTEKIHRQATCPSECTSQMARKVTVFAALLHMHYYGHKIHLDKYDASGNFVETVAALDTFDNGFQSNDGRIAFEVNPGESFQLHCLYNTQIHESPVDFGIDTAQEMCQIFLSYYPADIALDGNGASLDAPLSECGIGHDDTDFYSVCYPYGDIVGGQVDRTAKGDEIFEGYTFGTSANVESVEGTASACTFKIENSATSLQLDFACAFALVAGVMLLL